VETALCPELWQTEVDLHQFEQVIMNLALNARDAMPSGGTLILETSNTHLDDHYCFTHPHAEPGDYVALRVSDTGIGMDAKTLMHIFEPFFTTKGPGEGTGLGLSTVYGIVQQSRGVIDVQSQPGAGTTLTVYLPRANRPALDPAPHAPQSAVHGGHETILVVEDEAALRGLAHRVLHGLGYDVLVASEASEALDVVRERRGQIDLLVTDVVLPGGMQGPDLVANILALHPGLPVLYMSGYPRDTMMESGRLDGGVEFLQKPFAPAILVEAVRRVLAGAPT
jgi:CheY-like chemotaxis protein